LLQAGGWNGVGQIESAAGVKGICHDRRPTVTRQQHIGRSYTTRKNFTFIAQNSSAENIYIQSAQLNGKPLNRCWIMHGEIIAGGKLELVLEPEQNTEWGTLESKTK